MDLDGGYIVSSVSAGRGVLVRELLLHQHSKGETERMESSLLDSSLSEVCSFGCLIQLCSEAGKFFWTGID